MLRLTVYVAALTACGRVDFNPEAGICDFQHDNAAPFATAAEPYTICTADQLDQIGQHPELWSASFALAADLDVTARAPVPYIGSTATPFQGTFDGMGHTITGLHYDDATTTDAVGLFAVTTTAAHLENLTLASFAVRAGSAGYVGALVGYGYGSLIENITLAGGTVMGTAVVGGMIGGIECYDYPTAVPCPNGTIVRHITVNATVTSTATFDGTGGVFGYSGNQSLIATFDDIHSSGSVTGGAEVGGIGGDVEGVLLDHSDSSATVTAVQRAGGLTGDLTYANTVITRSHASGDVTCSDGLCGGAISETDGAGVSQVSASGTVICLGSGSCGGLAGDIEGMVSECYATGNVTSTEQTGGLVGYARGITDSYATGNVSGTTAVGALAGESSAAVARSYATGTVTASSDYASGLVGELALSNSISDSFATGSVTGSSASNQVGPLLGGITSGTYTSIGNATSVTCTNTAGACTPDATAMVIGDPSYFTTVTNAPMASWDFSTIWQSVGGALPRLRNAP